MRCRGCGTRGTARKTRPSAGFAALPVVPKPSTATTPTTTTATATTTTATATATATTKEEENDWNRWIWEASATLANARPPSDLCIYDKSGATTLSEANANASNNANASDHDHDPPVFDGSVANATPAGPHGTSTAGGSGTILHLACAMDRPLMLAFFLIAGADGRANHTAFRRLVVHEAACNGSIRCLALLLEMGRHYATADADADANADAHQQAEKPNHEQRPYSHSFRVNDTANDNDTTATTATATASTTASTTAGFGDVPFLPDAMELSPPSTHTQTHTHTPRPRKNKTPKNFGRAAHPAGREKDTTNGEARPHYEDYASILGRFQRLAGSVKEGLVSELEAARSLLANAPILETTQAALIRSCYFTRNQFHYNPSSSLSSSIYASHSFLRPIGCADGHGNTPLHWASFKNETECVALLLEYDADANARAHPSGWTPLHDAAYSNSPACIELLAGKGAQIDAKANSGATPLCFAAQEDASEAASLLLERGADLASRCAGPPLYDDQDHRGAAAHAHAHAQHHHYNHQYHQLAPNYPNHPHSRFSGYTPLHYCAHYNAQRASQVLLGHPRAKIAMEVADLSGRLPIHVAVARGSSDVLRALLHAGARVDIPPNGNGNNNGSSPTSVARPSPAAPMNLTFGLLPAPAAARQRVVPVEPGSPNRNRSRSFSSSATSTSSTSPVTSPILRSMIPSQPISSSKPWNCLSQQAIDECKELILKSEQSWSPDHHLLFTPSDRKAVMELLRVGKRLEQNGTGIFIDLWPTILSFCGRGWFETDASRKGAWCDAENTSTGIGIVHGAQSVGTRNHRAETNEDTGTDPIAVDHLDGNNYLALPSFE
mmetsp:Transcript_25840/g.54004  ORF Transcript_25840/g.54004 Transcript_25840/m.54004 type:complete len:840 (+) Transcript_25840:376-2895(+)